MADQWGDVLQQSMSSSVKRTCTRLVAALLLRGTSGKNSHRFGAKTLEDVGDGLPEPVPVGKQQHHRRDPPRHAQHGEDGLA